MLALTNEAALLIAVGMRFVARQGPGQYSRRGAGHKLAKDSPEAKLVEALLALIRPGPAVQIRIGVDG